MQEAAEFESIPTRIKAIRYTGGNEPALHKFGVPTKIAIPDGALEIWCQANRTWIAIEQGEWVAEDENGFYPIKHHTFIKKYKPVLSQEITGEVGQKFERSDG